MVNVETETNTDFPARSRLYRDGHVVLEDFPVADISDHLEANDGVIWLDLCCPNAQQLSVLETEFGLHKLAIEDALSEGQRTKLDRYRTHLFLERVLGVSRRGVGSVGHERSGGLHHA